MVNNETQEQEAEQKTEETPKTETETTPTENVGTEERTPIEKGQDIIKGIDEGMKKYETLVERQEKAAARMMLGGKADGGEAPKSSEEIEAEKIDQEVSDAVNRFN